MSWAKMDGTKDCRRYGRYYEYVLSILWEIEAVAFLRRSKLFHDSSNDCGIADV
jgi:hypothetical protein